MQQKKQALAAGKDVTATRLALPIPVSQKELPPGWVAEQLIRLPDAWWDEVAWCWTQFLRGGPQPGLLANARSLDIPKADGGEEKRLLGIAALLWRIGTFQVVAQLRS